MNLDKPQLIPQFPVSQQDYRPYLPSAYDPSLNIYETLVNLREYVNEVIRHVNKVEEEWYILKNWINEHLEKYAKEKIEQMFKDGYFDKFIKDLINPVLEEMNKRIDNNNAQLRKEFKDLVSSLTGGGITTTVKDETELKSKYPNGTKGIVVTTNNGHYWFWDTTANVWVDGGNLITGGFYNLVRPSDGKAIRLDNNNEWRADPDIITLKSGHYSVMVKTEESDPPATEYVITKNFPEAIKGVGTRCSVWVLELPENNRKDFVVKSNSSNNIFTSSLLPDGTMYPWSKIIQQSELDQVQVYKTTYNAGQGFGFNYRAKEGTPQAEETELVTRLVDLPTGIYYRGVLTPEQMIEKYGIDDFRGLPNNFRGGQQVQLIVNSYDSDRKSFILICRYFNTAYIGNIQKRNNDVDPKNQEIRWLQIGSATKPFSKQRRDFAVKVLREYDPNNINFMCITDTHIEHDAFTAQYATANATHLDNFDSVCDNILDYDWRVHLGDVVQGYGQITSTKGDKWQSMSSLLHSMKQFYSKDNSYAIYGNHDTNGGYAFYYGDVKEGIDEYYPQDLLNKVFIQPIKPEIKVNYYHIDNDKRKVRMIFINSYDFILTGDEKGKVWVSPYARPTIGKEQVKWIIQTLNNVPEGYKVILYTHCPLDNVFGDYAGYFNGDTVRKIIAGYQNKRKDTYSPSDIDNTHPQFDWYNAQGTYDFTNRQGGDIIAMFSGHQHIDKYIKLDNIMYIGLLCSKSEGGTSKEKPARDYFTWNEDSFRHISINEKDRTIKLLTFGAGEDYTINY